MPTYDEFLSWLRFALKRLYDSNALRTSPLIEVFGLPASANASSELRRTLTMAIRSLEPEADMPGHSQVWRVYEILLYRYLQQCSQIEVADQLGMSARHLRRGEGAALETLAHRLEAQFEIQFDDDQASGAPEAAPEVDESQSVASDELAWLEHSPPGELVELGEVLPAVLELARPVAARHSVHLEMGQIQDVIAVAVHPVALRQILLSLLTVAIRRASKGTVSVSATLLDSQVELKVRGLNSRTKPDSRADEAASLEMAERLTNLCRGRLTLDSDARGFTATVVLPGIAQLPVLLIDDNPDTCRLLQRYVSGTRYRIVGASDLQKAFSVAREVSPQIIVLDVMMPDVDGWEVLGRLRQHPLTSRVPVVVCTILAQEELALSLGASGFVRKPVSRQTFLNALDRLLCLAGQEPG